MGISNPRLIIDYRYMYFVWQLSLCAAYLVSKQFSLSCLAVAFSILKKKISFSFYAEKSAAKSMTPKTPSCAQPDNHMQGCITSREKTCQHKTTVLKINIKSHIKQCKHVWPSIWKFGRIGVRTWQWSTSLIPVDFPHLLAILAT